MEANNNTKGIFLILLGMAFFSVQDALIKYIYNDIALYELYMVRTITAFILLLSFMIIAKKKIFIDKNETLAWVIPISIILAFATKGLSLYFARLNINIVGQRISGELQKK